MGAVAPRPSAVVEANCTVFSRSIVPWLPPPYRRTHRRTAWIPQRRHRALTKLEAKQVVCMAQSFELPTPLITGEDVQHLMHAARLADSSAGLTQPHPNVASVVVDSQGTPVGEAYLWAQGTESAECQAVAAAGTAARGGTAYLNLEPGDCHGESAAVEALVQAGVARVVLGLRHPMPHFRGVAVEVLRRSGVTVQLLGEDPCTAEAEALVPAALDACLAVNAPLLHRVVTKKPLGVLKYAMTLDGKIATAQGHSAWVSSPESRQRVFEVRARSDAVIVGGETVRRDNPRLTTRREGGHQPARIVMSRTLDLPENANLWDVSSGAPTIVMTQRGARRPFQRFLRSRGVEVVEFDFLTPDAVARYCGERGHLQCLWECGGMLAAPAIAGGAIHKVMAFVAPKLIGGSRAPTPVGDLGFVEMTQALELDETRWEQVGPDLFMTGYLPRWGGLHALAAAAGVLPTPATASSGAAGGGSGAVLPGSSTAPAAGSAAGSRSGGGSGAAVVGMGASKWVSASARAPVAEFYKAWDRHGCLSNFSPHPICMPEGPMTAGRLRALLREGGMPEGLDTCGLSGPSESEAGDTAEGCSAGSRGWASVEHYYQAQKYVGVANPEAAALVEAIAAAASPEQAAALGRRNQFLHPELVREDWDRSKLAVMYAALRAKFATHVGPRQMLLSSVAGAPAAGQGAAQEDQQQLGSKVAGGAVVLVESSPHDFFWGRGFDGSGQNMLGKLLMWLREEMVKEQA